MLRLLLVLLVLLCAAGALAPVSAPGQSVDQRRQAVEVTLARAPACAKLGDLYWAVGDGDDLLAAGQRGRAVTASRRVPLGAAGKWLFAAYVAQRRQGDLGPGDAMALNMTSGYSRLNVIACRGASTVAGCPAPGPNSDHVGRFYYNNGHAQHLALVMGLGALDPVALGAEVTEVLGLSAPLVFDSPQLSSASLTPAAYGDFLRALTDNRLALGPLLGRHATCTLCPNGLYSPAPKPWSYSLGHWVEDGPGGGDGAFSSPGLFGLYPWISADHSTWGLLARNHMAKDSWWASAQCGALTRRAWRTARSQE